MKNLVYNTNMELKEIACEIAKKIQECGAKKVDVLDVTARTNQIKYMILAGLGTEADVRRTTALVKTYIENYQIEIFDIDGELKSDWVVIDCTELVIHLQTDQSRQKYNLEKLWKNSKNQIKF